MVDVGPITFGTTSKLCHAILEEKPHVSTSLRLIDRAFRVRMRFKSLHVDRWHPIPLATNNIDDLSRLLSDLCIGYTFAGLCVNHLSKC